MPEQGRVTVVAGRDADFFLRLPAWTPLKQVRAYRDGTEVPPDWRGAHLRFANATEDEELTITYPHLQFEQQVTLGQPAGREQWQRLSGETGNQEIIRSDYADAVDTLALATAANRWLGTGKFEDVGLQLRNMVCSYSSHRIG